jgi:hypothetical protein
MNKTKYPIFRILAIIFIFTICTFESIAQITPIDLFDNVLLKVDDQQFSWESNRVTISGKEQLHFEYEQDNSVVEVELYPNKLYSIRAIKLLPSDDYDIVDSLVNINDMYFRFKVKFKQLTKSRFLQFTFSIQSDVFVQEYLHELKLFHSTFTDAFLETTNNRLFIGEEKTFKISSNRSANIKTNNQWTRGKNINYKLSLQNGELLLQLRPFKAGTHQLKIPLSLHIPNFDETMGQFINELPPLITQFEVQTSKLVFLHTNRKDFTLKPENKVEGVEVELEYHPSLALKKTYRLEKKEESGGWLVAEIYTKNVLSNRRVLCDLRTYNYHRQSEGYLYLKDGDKAKFITNFDITPKTQIDRVSVLPKKGNYSRGNKIYPGETVEIKIEGEGLQKAKFSFEQLEIIPKDSLSRQEREMVFEVKVPMKINAPTIRVLNFGKPTGKTLSLDEFHIAHPLDFVSLKIGEEKPKDFANIENTIYFDDRISDIIIQFDPKKIDSPNRIFGKQNLKIEVIVTDKSNRLLDKQTLPDIVVCPGENSPRFDYYDSKKCRSEALSLNQYLRRKLYDLEGWDRIEIIIQHDRSKYGGQGIYKKAEIILRQTSSFDLDVSFPAGLLTKRVGTEGFGNLNGVSMAIIAQFSFYQPNRIAKPRPFKIGAGFLALNAFNFSENNTNRDVGVVILGSLYPIPKRERSKLSFPLFLGGGYFLSESKFFFLIGPGIRLSL